MNTEFAIKDLLPNPFRRMEHYPIRREKVEALKASLEKTGFWDNVVGRLNGKKVEIAYGHHRWTALKEFYENNLSHKVGIIIRDLSDEDMLHIMADENMDEWGTSAIVEIETVQAVVEAFAAGQIELEKPERNSPRGELRYAPSFVPGELLSTRTEVPYTALTVARFLGWVTDKGEVQAKVRNAITALQFIQEKLLTEADFVGATTSQCEAAIVEARRVKIYRENIAKAHQERAEQARREAEEEAEKEKEAESAADAHAAKVARLRAEKRQQAAEMDALKEREKARSSATRIGRTVLTDLRSGYGVKQARERAEKIDVVTRYGPPPHIEKYLRQILTTISNILTGSDPQSSRLDEVLKYRENLDPTTLEDAATILRELAGRANDYAERFSQIASNTNHK
jgi:hypothetical protein